MKFASISLLSSLLIAHAACGDDNGVSAPDAPGVDIDAAIDAAIDALPPALAAGCTEAACANTPAPATCTATPFMADGRPLTAALVNTNVTGPLNATGCDIGVYFTASGSVSQARIYGARYFGVLAHGASVTVNVNHATVEDINDAPLSGGQHGHAIAYYDGANGSVTANLARRYQKTGIMIREQPGYAGAHSMLTIEDNVIEGIGPTPLIAMNGITIVSAASGTLANNTISGHNYTGDDESCGIIVTSSSTVAIGTNTFISNELDRCDI